MIAHIILQSVIGSTSQESLLVEQPEVHLHPALQARLADMFVSLALKGRSQFILETHSEHLILRIQRWVRRGDLSPDMVSVVHVGRNTLGETTVRQLRLSESGDFLDEWPDGFFEERFEEIFGD
ncbi:MAG: AAA family ATPase [bacterium]|nr:AAA family ATPase [bacterium]